MSLNNQEMRELSLREIQIAEFNVLKRIKELCEELNIHYYIMFGTLLGAVRHKGFIPWDDDIDIMMFRNDYEKLIQYCNTNTELLAPFRLHHYSNDKKYIYPIARFSDTRYYVDYNTAENYNLGLFVDIYPFDGAGNTREEARRIAKHQRRLIVPICYGGLKSVTKSINGGFRTLLKYVMYYSVRIVGVHNLIKWADNNAKRISIDDSKYVENTCWELEPYKMFTYSDFGAGIELEFEGEFFRAPVNFDKILSSYYNNYMELPAEEDRVGHHYYKAYEK